jgi:hypothetical protein
MNLENVMICDVKNSVKNKIISLCKRISHVIIVIPKARQTV